MDIFLSLFSPLLLTLAVETPIDYLSCQKKTSSLLYIVLINLFSNLTMNCLYSLVIKELWFLILWEIMTTLIEGLALSFFSRDKKGYIYAFIANVASLTLGNYLNLFLENTLIYILIFSILFLGEIIYFLLRNRSSEVKR